MLAVALAVIGGSIAFGFALSRKSMKALRERVAVLNAGIRGVAEHLALPCREPAPYRHPIVGDVPSTASIHGEHRGRSLRVEVQSDEDAQDIVLVLMPPRGTKWPKLGKLDPDRDAARFASLAALSGLTQDVRLTATELRMIASKEDTPSLLATLDAALALASELDRV